MNTATNPYIFDAQGTNNELIREGARKAEYLSRIRRLVWVYFFLLIFEGALRKWVMPMFANPILLIRDPVVIWAYMLAIRSGLFPRDKFLMIGCLLGWIMFLVGLITMNGSLLVPFYGVRTDFLHWPFIFLMARVLNKNDVRKIGYWILLLAIPMTLLMAAQFKADANAWINSGSDESFKQIGALNYTRAPGTFSFISGPMYFYAMAAAFLMEGLFSGRAYPKWLTISGALAVGMAPFVSGSRSLVSNVVIVLACALVAGTVLQPRMLLRTIKGICIGLLVGLALAQIPVFQEGFDLLNDRFSNSDGGFQKGFVMRFLDEITITQDMWNSPPLWGYGLGIGTNVGSVLNSNGRNGFIYGESEWTRIFSESGPALGICFIFLRSSLVIYLLMRSIRAGLRGNVLPFFLIGAAGTDILNGQWGQACTLGFAIFGGGLCLAALNENDFKNPRDSIGEKEQIKQGKI